jgi:hypothetical protein
MSSFMWRNMSDLEEKGFFKNTSNKSLVREYAATKGIDPERAVAQIALWRRHGWEDGIGNNRSLSVCLRTAESTSG